MSEDRFSELKARQSKMWGSGPYERISDHLRPAHEHLMSKLQPRPGLRWLDVATGTGELACPAAAAGAVVTGVDLSPVLIDKAGARARKLGLDIKLDVGDAERLPYEDASFDIVSSSFGAMFAPDHKAVAGELARVCRLGGRLGLATWRADSGVGDLFRIMAPFQPPPPQGAGSPFAWGREDYVTEMLGVHFQLAFEDGDAPESGESGEDLWQLWSTAYGPTKTLANSLDDARREELHRAWVNYFEGLRTNGQVRQSRHYLIVLGVRSQV